MTKKYLMIVTLVTILVLAQMTVALADPGGPEGNAPLSPAPAPAPVGGHTEPARPLVLLWPWLALAAVATMSTIAVITLKRRTA